MIIAIFSSSLLSVILTAIYTKLINDKNERNKYVTNERQIWRKEIREKTYEVVNKKEISEADITFFEIRLNPFDKYDNEIIEKLKGNNRVAFSKGIAYLLKHGWERVKWETSNKIVAKFFKKMKYEQLKFDLICTDEEDDDDKLNEICRKCGLPNRGVVKI